MIEAIETTLSHLPFFWDMLEEHGIDEFFSDEAKVNNYEDFVVWWDRSVEYSLTGLMDGQPAGCGYLNMITPGYVAWITIFKKKGNLSFQAPNIFKENLGAFFEKFNLYQIKGLVRTSNRPCQALFKYLKFTVDGTMRAHNHVRGQWQDYYTVSLLRSEYGKR